MAKKPKHSFFDPNNIQAKAIREGCMEVRELKGCIALNEMELK